MMLSLQQQREKLEALLQRIQENRRLIESGEVMQTRGEGDTDGAITQDITMPKSQHNINAPSPSEPYGHTQPHVESFSQQSLNESSPISFQEQKVGIEDGFEVHIADDDEKDSPEFQQQIDIDVEDDEPEIEVSYGTEEALALQAELGFGTNSYISEMGGQNDYTIIDEEIPILEEPMASQVSSQDLPISMSSQNKSMQDSHASSVSPDTFSSAFDDSYIPPKRDIPTGEYPSDDRSITAFDLNVQDEAASQAKNDVGHPINQVERDTIQPKEPDQDMFGSASAQPVEFSSQRSHETDAKVAYIQGVAPLSRPKSLGELLKRAFNVGK